MWVSFWSASCFSFALSMQHVTVLMGPVVVFRGEIPGSKQQWVGLGSCPWPVSAALEFDHTPEEMK